MSLLLKKNNGRRGQAMIISVIFFIFISTTAILGLTNPLVNYLSIVNGAKLTKQSFYTSESLIEDVVFRLKSGGSVNSPQNLSIGSSTAVVTITDGVGSKIVSSVGNNDNYIRKNEIRLVLGEGVAFNYGIQVGSGGLIFQNSSSVTGNVYSNGQVVGVGNNISGSVVSAGPSGLVDNIHSNDSVYSHTITNANIDKNAYFSIISNSTVSGTSYPGSTDQATSSFPISDEMIEEWESEALTGGIISSPCPYIINSSTAIGPKKINCDVEVSGNNTVFTLTGPIWVSGNITTKNSSIIRISPSLGNKSVAIIADNQTNRTTSSKISIQNSSTFQGSGSAGSFVFMISQNNSAKNGGNEEAISVSNSTSGALVVYSNSGEVSIQNSVSLKEITAYKINLKNTANVIYDSGLPNTLFSAGPSGGFDILKWGEIN